MTAKRKRPRIVAFAEDPGAANFVAALSEAPFNQVFEVSLFAAGAAEGSFSTRGCKFERVARGDAEEASRLVRTCSPDIVIVGTSENLDSFGLKLLDTARKSGISTIGVLDACMNTRYRFSGRTSNPLRFAPDYIFVPDSFTQQAFLNYGLTQNQVRVTGHPHFDDVIDIRKQLSIQLKTNGRQMIFPDLPDNKKLIVFCSEKTFGVVPDIPDSSVDYLIHGTSGSSSRTIIVLEELLHAIRPYRDRLHLVLRLHPKDTISAYSRYEAEFDDISQYTSPFELIFISDLVIGMTTTLLLEAALMNVATLSILPRVEESEWLLTTRSGVTPYATSRSQVERLLSEYMSDSQGFRTKFKSIHDFIVSDAKGRLMEHLRAVLQ